MLAKLWPFDSYMFSSAKAHTQCVQNELFAFDHFLVVLICKVPCAVGQLVDDETTTKKACSGCRKSRQALTTNFHTAEKMRHINDTFVRFRSSFFGEVGGVESTRGAIEFR